MRPALEQQVLGGALNPQDRRTLLHVTVSLDPEEGGFYGAVQRFMLVQGVPIEYGMRAVELDTQRKKIGFANGRQEYYDQLVSTLPLPELVKICKNAPAAVRAAAEKRTCTSHFLLSVGINRPHISDAYWTYYYDDVIPFSRASFPSKYSQKTANAGCSSVQVEVVHSRYKEIPSQDTLVEQCLGAMEKVGLLQSPDEIVALDARDIRYANVLFDFDRVPNRDVVHGWMDANGIHWAGRYGEWAYLWTDQSILSGERAANEIRAALDLTQGTSSRASACNNDPAVPRV